MSESLIIPRIHLGKNESADDSERVAAPLTRPVDVVIDPWRTIAPAKRPARPIAEPDSDRHPSGLIKPDIDPAMPATPGPPASALAAPVTIIAGYEVISLLGRGAMGVIYKARQISLNRNVALKMVLAGSHAGDEERARFLSEAEAVAALRHPNIVQVYEVGEHEGLPFFSMEIVDGGNLDCKTRGKPMPARSSAALMEKVALAMHYAHQQGVVHRDLKPANVMLTVDGEPKITDFGLAKRLQSDTHERMGRYATQTGTAVGTPSYMAPEQASGQGKLVGPRADVYSLGAMLYELLTGRPPFVADSAMDTLLLVVTEEPPSPSRLQPRLPKDLVTITLKCLCKEPEKRYNTAGELADDLRRFLDDEPIRAVPTSRWMRLVKWAKRRPAAAALIAVSHVAALALLGGGIAYQIKLNRALGDATAQRLAAVQRLVRLNVQTGMDLADTGRLPSALPNLVEALRLSAEMNRDLGKQTAKAAAEERMHRMRLAMVLRSCPRLIRAWFHQGRILDTAFSPDGKRVVTAGSDSLASVWDIASGDRIGPDLQHGGIVHQASFSPDGNRVLTAGSDGLARIWEVGSGREVCRSPQHDGEVTAASFSTDGQRFCTASTDGTARVCDARDGRLLFSPIKHPSAVRLALFSPNGQWLLTVAGNSARLWHASSGTPSGTELRHNGAVLTASFDNKSTSIVTGGEDNVARLWKVADGLERTPALRHDRAVVFAGFSPDGTRVATASNDGTARVWQSASGQPVSRRMTHHDRVRDLTFSPNGRYVATGSCDNSSVIWDAETGDPVSHAMVSNGNIVRVRFSPDGRHLLTSSESGVARMWYPVLAFRKPRPTSGSCAGPLDVKSNDGRLVARSVDKHSVQIRDVRSGQSIGPPIRSGRELYSAAFDPAGERLLTTSCDGTGRIWDVVTGKCLAPPLTHGSPVMCGAFSLDGKLVATGSSDNTSRVWNAATGEPETPFMKHKASVYRVVFTPDGGGLLTFSEDGSARIWDADNGERITPPLDPEGWVKQAAETPGDPEVWQLSVEGRQLEEMKTVAEWLSGSRICETTGDLTPNPVGRFHNLSELIQTNFPHVRSIGSKAWGEETIH